ncbi:MAG: hypothetical protein AAGJ70_00395 [Pseudomonadota bacterium]
MTFYDGFMSVLALGLAFIVFRGLFGFRQRRRTDDSGPVDSSTRRFDDTFSDGGGDSGGD